MSIFDSMLILALVATTACAPAHDTPSDADTAIAFASDFAGYESWQPSFHFDAELDAAAPDPDAGSCTTPHNFTTPRDVYVKTTATSAPAAFPVGTMLVKEARVSADPATWQLYAMVKRDESFNPGSGCAGWEWFELSASGAATPARPQIVWRGVGPPIGAAYQNCPACSSCHASAGNDCAWSVPLSSF